MADSNQQSRLMDAPCPYCAYLGRPCSTHEKKHSVQDDFFIVWATLKGHPTLDPHAALRRIEEQYGNLVAAVRENAEASDYCIACDCHPSHGHAEGCPIA